MTTRGGTGADARRARERCRGQFGLGDPGKYRGVTVAVLFDVQLPAAEVDEEDRCPQHLQQAAA